MLDALAGRKRYAGRAAVVVAHPDDETIAAGGSLHLLPDVLLVHVTDGAPRRLGDAARGGFETPEAYAAAREAELAAALALVPGFPLHTRMSWPGLSRPSTGPAFYQQGQGDGSENTGQPGYSFEAVGGRVNPPQPFHDEEGTGRVRLNIPDQDATLHLRSIAEALATLFRDHGTTAVLTHAYEGGHPDHDATALAVHRAAGQAGIPVFEFAGYHAGPGATVMQQFLPGPAETCIALPSCDAARKRAMLGCFRTQAEILSRFDPAVERFRPAPGYDFTEAPHPGPLNYEAWGWELTGARWRALATEAIPCAA